MGILMPVGKVVWNRKKMLILPMWRHRHPLRAFCQRLPEDFMPLMILLIIVMSCF